MDSSEEYTTSEIPEFTRVPGSQVKSVVHDHIHDSTVKTKTENQSKIQFSVLSV